MFDTELAQLRELEDVSDDAERQTRRNAINARLRELAAADEHRTRDFLDDQDLCVIEELWNSMCLVEALALATMPPIELLRWYFQRAVEKVSRCPRDGGTLALTSFAFLEQSSSDAKTQLLPEYVKLAGSEIVQLRLAAIELFGGFEIAAASVVRAALQRLLRDSDWRVRQRAEILLREESLLPEGYATPWRDRIRRLLRVSAG